MCGLCCKTYDNEVGISVLEDSKSFSKEYFLQRMAENGFKIYFGATCNKMYETDILKKYDIVFNKNIEYAEDMLFNLEYIRCIKKISSIKDCLYYYNDTSGSLSKTENEKMKYNSAKIRYSYAMQLFKESKILNVCMKDVCTAMALELIGPTYDICKENYKGIAIAKKELGEIYNEKIVRLALKHNKNSTMVHKIAKIAINLKSYTVFIVLMRMWIPIQKIFKIVDRRSN